MLILQKEVPIVQDVYCQVVVVNLELERMWKEAGLA
jgi:hypothetical protein